MRLHRAGLICLAVSLAAGCGHSAAHSGQAGYPSAASGSPAFCTKLAQSQPVRDLQAELTAAAEHPSAGAEQLDAVAGALTQIGSTAPAALRPGFSSAAADLRLLASDGLQSAALQKVTASLTVLGQEVEKPCGFPVG
jgi:hypothetical protein